MAEARAFWITGPRQSAIRRQPLLPAKDGSVTVRTLYSGISGGTERLVYEGRVPASQVEVMRAPFQDGAFPGPVLYGYANVGVIEEGPEREIGRRVFCLYPHVDRFTVAPSALLDIPDDVPAQRAVLAANMETALNAVWDARPLPGERVAVSGAGVVGALCAYLCGAQLGGRPLLIDVDEGRRPIAEALGAEFALSEAVDGDFDLIIHASGNPAGLARALELAAFEARIVELSWYGDRFVPLPLGEHFHSRRISIISSQVGHVAPAMRSRMSRSERLGYALSLLSDPCLERLIDMEVRFEQLPSHFGAMSEGEIWPLCTRVHYQ